MPRRFIQDAEAFCIWLVPGIGKQPPDLRLSPFIWWFLQGQSWPMFPTVASYWRIKIEGIAPDLERNPLNSHVHFQAVKEAGASNAPLQENAGHPLLHRKLAN